MEGDTKAIVEHLRLWGGPWVLVAINPNGPGIETRTFSREGEAVEWVRKHNEGGWNIYFAVNPCSTAVSKKPSRADVKSMNWLHVDVDPDKTKDLAEERERIRKLLLSPPEGIPQPTYILFSGGGFQAFWRLSDPVPIDGEVSKYEDAARYNKALEVAFGADGCHNVDRIMRLPGTVNWPDERKKAAGREPALAIPVGHWPDRVYHIDDFRPAPTVQGSGTGATRVEIDGNVRRVMDLDELPAAVSRKARLVIAQGHDPEDAHRHPSRSEWVFFAACELVRAGTPDDVIFSILTDPDWPISESVLGKGSGAERYAIRQIERAREHAIDPHLAEMNDRHGVISSLGGQCRVLAEEPDPEMGRSRVVFHTFQDLKNRYSNRKVMVQAEKGEVEKPLGMWWLDHPNRRQYETVVFAPGRTIEGCYNLWKGFAYDAKAGDCSLFLEHVRQNVCAGDEEHYQYLMRWAARAVQHPDEQGHVAVVLRGDMGTGKGFFARTIGQLFGQHFMQISDSKHLVGSFNAHLRDCVVLFADEAFYAGDKKHEGVLKSIVTEDTLAVEAKGVDVRQSRNYLHLIMASNSAWVVPSGLKERRFFVLDVGDGSQQDKPYFRAIQRQLDAGGYEALLHLLMHLDLDGFQVRDIPGTEALRDQKLLSMPPEMQWWYAKLESGMLTDDTQDWPEMVFKTELTYDYFSFMRFAGRSRLASPGAVGDLLKKVVPGITTKRLAGDHNVRGVDGQMREVHRPRVYDMKTLKECREHFDEHFGGPYEWPSPEGLISDVHQRPEAADIL